MKRKLPEKFFEQNQRAKTRKWKFFNLNQALWGAGNREFRDKASAWERWSLFRILEGSRSVYAPHSIGLSSQNFPFESLVRQRQTFCFTADCSSPLGSTLHSQKIHPLGFCREHPFSTT